MKLHTHATSLHVRIVSSPVACCAGAGVQGRPEAVLEALSWPRNQRTVQLSSVPSHLQDPGQSRTPTQVSTRHTGEQQALNLKGLRRLCLGVTQVDRRAS